MTIAVIQSNTTLDWIKETLSEFPQDFNGGINNGCKRIYH